MVEIIFIFISSLTAAICYAFSDHGFITFISQTKPIFNKLFQLRGFMIYNRHIFEFWFIATVVTLTIIQLYFVFTKKKLKTRLIFLGIFCLSLAYPFLSSDIFSYLFSAKILYFYKLNPYTTIPETLRDQDIWLSFTYWTHRPYIYGPLALFVSLIPMFIFGVEKFLTIFYFSKILNVLLFIATGIIISKIIKNKRKAIYLWFTNPLLLIELVINSHNETIMLFLFFLSALFWKNSQKTKSIIALSLSVLTKYISILFSPLIFLKKTKKTTLARIMIIVSLIVILAKYNQAQLWYFSWIYFALPFAKLKKNHLTILFIFQLILTIAKYQKFISTGNW